ncbi:MAG: SusF/SusE family outer membrane protein [Paludibacter sp.]|nr:SusF/SusE family outer membrane protein [Paludibacter sp.]
MKKIISFLKILPVIFLSGLFFMTSCETEYPDDNVKAGPLALTASQNTLVLSQKQVNNTAVMFNWTTGTNNGTGASISYALEVDKQGNDFSDPIRLNMGKGKYSQSFTTGELNDTLLTRWNGVPGTAVNLEARVISTIYTTPVTGETSPVISISVTPYQPVSKTLYIIGSASPNGWSADNAIELLPQADPTVFVYQGGLGVGTFKFITTKGQFLPSYNKGADDTKIVLRTSDSEPDEQFNITESAVYKVTVSLLDLSIVYEQVDLPAYTEIYMVGDATPNGWDISNATQLVQSNTDPFVFTYTGVMNAGDFKFPVNRNSDWGQDMFMRESETKMYLHKGGDPDDEKWTITKKGFYVITLNLAELSINIHREKLYMVGSATPIGWNIGDAIELTEDATDGCVFTYSGPMVVGEFKFPVNRNSDWGQDMYMRTSDTKMYRHKGGDPDDEKWNITVAGDYVITANLETLDISIVKQ